MQRITVVEPRYIHLEWDEPKKAYLFRLMRGRQFMTPKWWMSPLDWYGLMSGHRVGLEGWFALIRQGGYLEIRHFKDLVPLTKESQDWPSIFFEGLYRAATVERGCKPETGWHDVYDAQLEAQREEWGSA